MAKDKQKDTTRTPDAERDGQGDGAPMPGARGGDIRHTNFAHAEPESNVGPAGAPQTSRGSAGKPGADSATMGGAGSGPARDRDQE